MTLISANIELFIRGKSLGGGMSGYLETHIKTLKRLAVCCLETPLLWQLVSSSLLI